MNFLRFFQIILILFFSHTALSQEFAYQRIEPSNNNPDSTNNHGNIEIVQDPRVDSVLKMFLDFNQYQDGIMGYRVQIFFDAGNLSLEKATAAAKQFQTLFPEDTAYISFTEPYYRVRVGDFRTRLEARGYIQEIQKEYPNAFVIRDKIRFRNDN